MTASGGQRRPPWWRRTRNLVMGAGVVVVGVVLAVVLATAGSSSNPAAAQEVEKQAKGTAGKKPFTPPVSAEKPTEQTGGGASPESSSAASAGTKVSGGEAGLYGGSTKTAVCDVPKLTAYLDSEPDKARAWASVQGIQPSEIGSYLGGLTPVVLRADTRVTNHGYQDGEAIPYQAVLEAGTAVLVDSYGVPRVRCACGNPLTPPEAIDQPTYTGDQWASFQSDKVVTVEPAPQPVGKIVLVDEETGGTYDKPVGTTGSPSGSPGSASPGSVSPGSPVSPGTVSPGSGPASGGPSGPSAGVSPYSPPAGGNSPPAGGNSGSPASPGGGGGESPGGNVSAPAGGGSASQYGAPALPTLRFDDEWAEDAEG
ncbi:DUF6777 domain-containing protein [Kitasatospora camelliae]|uniref:DUF6777 domain-containing protein n=1 Tax=Kitasatospora camelliae TaxID=3156397 RepID=A0AAU8K4T4_9ACTN